MAKSKLALLSVYDKSGVVELAKTLIENGYEIVSSGGTAKALEAEQIPVIPIQQITGNPEAFDGRMKTISFQVESGLLYDRTNPAHVRQAKKLGIRPIDLVVCNLYPFEQTIAKPKVSQEEAVENIDVGGPTMVRSAAKNFKNVLVVVDPADYPKIAQAITKDSISLYLRQSLAAKAFHHLSFYDTQVANYLDKEDFPGEFTVAGRNSLQLRYGENPHQQAVVYFNPQSNSPLKNLEQLAGRGLSYVNMTDIYAGLESVHQFAEPAAVVIKHNTPCGIALGETAAQALDRAIEADPESAFGGVIVLNQPMDLKTAEQIAKFKSERRSNIDIVAVPDISDDALELIKTTRKTTGVYRFGKIPKRAAKWHYRFIDGGFIVQTADESDSSFAKWQTVSKLKPTAKQLEQMRLGWKFISRIRSNCILVIDKNLPKTVGIGTGQTSRVRATRIALEQAGEHARGAILVSDSFFPFDDSVKLAAKAGIEAIVQQGGSVNDQASIDAANAAGIKMVFTSQRAFWH